jgi:hypothetical protein
MDHQEKTFVREPRYVVFKLKDIHAYLTQERINALQQAGEGVSAGRRYLGKPPFNAVVVEQDWPEFDLVWEMIEARMTGAGNDHRRIVACVNACAELPQDALDGGWTALGMSRHARNVEKQRDELLALVNGFYRKLETYRNVYSGDKELRRLLSECEAAIAKAQP